ncbi:MAG: hypothetical protein NVSMB1_17320 [Polyangiales bacterium]
MSVQPPAVFGHDVPPVGQTQAPAVHEVVFEPQLELQLPQFLTSVLRSAHPAVPAGEDGQNVAPPAHMHAPIEQVPPAPQEMPHPPQFFASLVVSMHPTPGHNFDPDAQVQTPAEQVPPAPHTLPQLPQLLGSVALVTHFADAPKPHNTSPAVGQVHFPVPNEFGLHVVPVTQTLSQPPQFFESVVVSMQTPPHNAVGLVHVTSLGVSPNTSPAVSPFLVSPVLSPVDVSAVVSAVVSSMVSSPLEPVSIPVPVSTVEVSPLASGGVPPPPPPLELELQAAPDKNNEARQTHETLRVQHLVDMIPPYFQRSTVTMGSTLRTHRMRVRERSSGNRRV